MTKIDQYTGRLWSLHNPARGKVQVNSPSDLLRILREDFSGPQAIFSAAEYRDPDLRQTVIIDISHPDTGAYVIFEELSTLLRKLLGEGPVLSLYSGFGDLVLQFGAGIAVEPRLTLAEWSRLFAEMTRADVEVITAEPLAWNTDRRFDRIVCNPPFGSKIRESELFQKIVSLMAERGRAAIIVPGALLWRSDRSAVRKFIAENAHVSGVISLPSGVFPGTSIQTVILLLEKNVTGKTYLASSKSPADFAAIAADYAQWHSNRKYSLGFEADVSPDNWSVAYYEPIDFGFGEVKFPYRVANLGDITTIASGRPSEKARIAINKTGSKTVAMEGESHLVARNNIYLTPSEQVNPSFLLLYLNSSVGQRALKRLIKGETIPHINAKDLLQLPVVLPELRQQNQIVSDALELGQTVASLQALTIEGEQALKENLFGLQAAKEKFQKFSATTEKARYQQLPFPIAVVQRKITNAPNNTQKFSLLIELFEVVIRFIALVHLADYINNRKQAGLVAEQVPDIKKLFAPALGDWVGIFKAFARIEAVAESTPFLAEIKSFRLDKYQRTLQEFVDIRNASLRGHGATLTEDEYELRFQEHAPKVYELVSNLGFLANYTLVKSGQMNKDGDFYKIAVHTLMGDNPHFEAGHIVLRTPLDSNKVLYLNRNQESLVLDPYIVLERCPECGRPEVLLFDKLSDKKITYLSYESGHRPSLPHADRLPPIIREVATRRV